MSCRSNRRHGSYVRRLEERPMLDRRVVLAVEVRRFKCANAGCQRRTQSQARALHALGHALGGEAAARLANALGLRTSADTALRELRRAPERKREPRPRGLGIDDWAIARGHQYGTIIVDLERREPIEVFAGREGTAVARVDACAPLDRDRRQGPGWGLLRGGRHRAAGSHANLGSLASTVQLARQR
uniref:hypothetical protein n=1 Tax=Cupriavidus taiwanensis TaxID=164546 RepID=UPI003F497E44